MPLFGLETLVVLGIFLAFVFDFINGFHDSANAIATVVATRVLKPFQAVLMAGFFNFVGPFVFSLAVAATVGKGIIDAKVVTPELIIAALIGAIVWDLVTWWWGLPTSSSHALVGGLVGAALAAVGVDGVLMPTRREMLDIATTLGQGAIGGVVVGAFFVAWSRVKLPRPILPIFSALGMLGLGYFIYQHTDYTKDFAKGLVVSAVFVLLGGLAGVFLWAGSQQPAQPRIIPWAALPGAFGTLAAFTLLQKISMGGLTKAIVFMFVSPVLGFFMGFAFYGILQWLWRRKNLADINRWSSRLQLGSSAFYALTHGTNDAQKTMGVIGVLLIAGGALTDPGGKSLDLPYWVILGSATAMGLGTAFGGWRIVRTMASRITHLRPHQGFAAETAGGVVLVAMAESGIPVSTTHAISSSIMGVGASRRASAVRWSVGRQMFIAWIWTIPASAIVAAITYYLIVAVLRAAGVT